MKTPLAHFKLHENMVGHLGEIMTFFLVLPPLTALLGHPVQPISFALIKTFFLQNSVSIL